MANAFVICGRLVFMPSTRTKTINIDGAEFVIGSLTIQQVRDNFTDKPTTVIEAPTPGTKSNYYGDPVFDKLFLVICHSLNNVLGYFDPADSLVNPLPSGCWNKARCIREIDGDLLLPLHNAIIEYSGLKIIGETKPGEDSAASAS